jgi:signal transduction histidine kinase
MNNLLEKFGKFGKLGKVERFEVKNNSLCLFLIGPVLFLYSYLNNNYGDNSIRIEGAREVSALLFLGASILPFIFKKTITHFYGWIVFLVMLMFTHYLLINLQLNSFNIRFVLGFYAIVFGSVLLFNNRRFINLYFVTVFLHLIQKLMTSQIDDVTYYAVLSSFSLTFIFGLILLNDAASYRSVLSKKNEGLEKGKIKSRSDLKKRAKDLEEKNKDLEDFAQIVSHDLKTPLRNISALTYWLREDIENKSTTVFKENLGLLERQVFQMDLIIEGVLNYSLQNEATSSYEQIDLDNLIKDIIVLNKNNNCLITIKNKLPLVTINKSQILQIFQNLIQNAIKYNVEEICEIEIDYTQNDKFYTFSIKDNGIGIDEKYHKKIFKLFQKLEIKKVADSSGIGLSLVKKIVKRNKGKIYLKSQVDKGTTFYFTLPI